MPPIGFSQIYSCNSEIERLIDTETRALADKIRQKFDSEVQKTVAEEGSCISL